MVGGSKPIRLCLCGLLPQAIIKICVCHSLLDVVPTITLFKNDRTMYIIIKELPLDIM